MVSDMLTLNSYYQRPKDIWDQSIVLKYPTCTIIFEINISHNVTHLSQVNIMADLVICYLYETLCINVSRDKPEDINSIERHDIKSK